MGGDQLTGGVELTGRDNWLGTRVDWGDHNLNKADRSNYACIYGDKIDGNIDANDRASKWNGWKADILLFLLLLLLLDCFDICHVGLFWRCERIVIRCYHKIRLQWETPTIENNSQQITIQSLETIIHNLRIFLRKSYFTRLSLFDGANPSIRRLGSGFGRKGGNSPVPKIKTTNRWNS